MPQGFLLSFIRQRTLSSIADAVARWLGNQDPATLHARISACSDLADELAHALFATVPAEKIEEYRTLIAQHISLFSESDIPDLFGRVLWRLGREHRAVLEANRSWCLDQLKRVWNRLLSEVLKETSGASR